MIHPQECGPCDDCREAIRDYADIIGYTGSEDEGENARLLTRNLRLPAPTVDEFLKHARLFGVDCVYETAEVYLPKPELDRMLLGLHEIAAEHAKDRQPETWWKGLPESRRQGTPQERKVLTLWDAGMTPAQIVNRTGYTMKRVMKIVSDEPRAAEREATHLARSNPDRASSQSPKMSGKRVPALDPEEDD